MKTSALFGALVLSISVFAQAPSVSSAKIAMDRGDLPEAKKYIDEATEIIQAQPAAEQNPKLMPKYYAYRGQVYYKLYKDEALTQSSYLDEAAKSFSDCIDYESASKKKRYTNDANEYLKAIIVDYTNIGNDSYPEDLKGSRFAYEQAVVLNKTQGVVDSNSLSNIGLISMQLRDFQRANEVYTYLVQNGYKGIYWTVIDNSDSIRKPINYSDLELLLKLERVSNPERSESQLDYYYSQLLVCYDSLQMNEAYDSLLTEARTKFPSNNDLLNLELMSFFQAENYDGALSRLIEAMELFPDNPIYPLNYGLISYDHKDDAESARTYFLKTLEIDPNTVDAWYMLGTLIYNEGKVFYDEVAKLHYTQKTKIEKLEKQAEAKFKEALPFFEQAYKLNPEDELTIQALKQIYYKLEMEDEFKAINK